MLVITVTFEIDDAHLDAFRRAVLANAAKSMADEPGCRLFDVAEHPDKPEFFLYELYDDDAAFDAHRASPHFRQFDAETAAWVKVKRVTRFRRLGPATHL